MKIEILPIQSDEPHYTLTTYYMIGDANGDMEFSTDFSKLNPSIENGRSGNQEEKSRA